MTLGEHGELESSTWWWVKFSCLLAFNAQASKALFIAHLTTSLALCLTPSLLCLQFLLDQYYIYIK